MPLPKFRIAMDMSRFLPIGNKRTSRFPLGGEENRQLSVDVAGARALCQPNVLFGNKRNARFFCWPRDEVPLSKFRIAMDVSRFSPIGNKRTSRFPLGGDENRIFLIPPPIPPMAFLRRVAINAPRARRHSLFLFWGPVFLRDWGGEPMIRSKSERALRAAQMRCDGTPQRKPSKAGRSFLSGAMWLCARALWQPNALFGNKRNARFFAG